MFSPLQQAVLTPGDRRAGGLLPVPEGTAQTQAASSWARLLCGPARMCQMGASPQCLCVRGPPRF